MPTSVHRVTDPIDQAVLLVDRHGYGSPCISATWFGVAGSGFGSIARMITVTDRGAQGPALRDKVSRA